VHLPVGLGEPGRRLPVGVELADGLGRRDSDLHLLRAVAAAQETAPESLGRPCSGLSLTRSSAAAGILYRYRYPFAATVADSMSAATARDSRSRSSTRDRCISQLRSAVLYTMPSRDRRPRDPISCSSTAFSAGPDITGMPGGSTSNNVGPVSSV
jgi:hypothetical protein